MIAVKSQDTKGDGGLYHKEVRKSHIIFKKHEEGSKLAGINYSLISRIAVQCPCLQAE